MKLAIFDIDGTLIDMNPEIDDRMFVKAMQEKAGFVITREWNMFKNATDSGITRELYEMRLNRPPTPAEAAEIRERYGELLEQELADQAKSYGSAPGARDLLVRLVKESGWGVAVATGNWGNAAKMKLGSAGVEIGDAPLANADDDEVRANIIRIATDRSRKVYGQESFERVVYVGDRQWDLEAARALGIGFVGVTHTKGHDVSRLEGWPGLLADFADFAQVVLALESAHIPEAR